MDNDFFDRKVAEKRLAERRARNLLGGLGFPYPAGDILPTDPQFNIDRLRLRVREAQLEVERAQIDLQEAMFRAGQIGPKTTIEKDHAAALSPDTGEGSSCSQGAGETSASALPSSAERAEQDAEGERTEPAWNLFSAYNDGWHDRKHASRHPEYIREWELGAAGRRMGFEPRSADEGNSVLSAGEASNESSQSEAELAMAMTKEEADA
jgi:hypothetical protein